MTRIEYQRSLDDLRADVREMGDLVVDRLETALVALEENDEALAETVIQGDDEINRRYLSIEGDCVDLLALQGPVASDLRFVVASFKIITDLERVGDLAANLAQYALVTDRRAPSEVDIYRIGDDAREMLEASLSAYLDGDAERCHEIAARDDEIDALCGNASDRIVRDLIETRVEADDEWAIERVMDDVTRLLLTIRDLERVGDHAVNIAARTLYMVENDPELVY